MDAAAVLDEVSYPESDGKPMADNTLQWDWMVKIVVELKDLFAGKKVFVAGNLFWYPVKGDPKTVMAPDGLVAFDRAPGYRGSYKQWEEDGVAPQVVFEVLSPNNTPKEMKDKLEWYDCYGVEEYYFIDPYEGHATGWVRKEGRLTPVESMNGHMSPRLGVRFETNGEVRLYRPDGREFQSPEDRMSELEEQAEQNRRHAEEQERRAEEQQRRAEEERNRAEAARLRAEQLAEKLRELGVNPDDLHGGNSDKTGP